MTLYNSQSNLYIYFGHGLIPFTVSSSGGSARRPIQCRMCTSLTLIYNELIQPSPGPRLRPHRLPQQHHRPRVHREGLQHPHRPDYQRRERTQRSPTKGNPQPLPQRAAHQAKRRSRRLGQRRLQSRRQGPKQKPGHPRRHNHRRLYV